MRKTLILAFVLLLAVSGMAQQRTGNIIVTIVDKDGARLPGVTVTLISPFGAVPPQVSSAEGVARFLSLPPSREYAVKLELQGFKTKTETGITVNLGINADLTLTLEQGVLTEEITVVGKTPVVDQKKTSVGTNVTQELLQSLPTARDPWVILQMAPSIIVDRENVGGNESGQQSSYVARGAASYNDNVWAMDGVVITDPAAIGASPSYYDFDAFEEMSIIVGGADVTVQTGGIALNMVTRRGGNALSLGGRFYVTDNYFQSEEIDPKWAKEGLPGINKIENIKDYGFNLGIPLIKDKAWFWGSYGVQDIKTYTVFGTKDDTLLQNYAAKLNISPIANNRFEAFIHAGGKYKWGRSTSTSNPEGLYQAGGYHFGSPITKLQDEHMFGDNLFVSLKYAFSDAGFMLIPMTDRDLVKMAIWDVTANRYYGSQASRYYVERPVSQYNAVADYFNDNLLGMSHSIKVGFEYADRAAYTESVWTGNLVMNRNYNSPQLDLNGDKAPDIPTSAWKYFSFSRGYYRDQGVTAIAGYFQDTVTIGRFNLLIGLRYDYQTPRVNPVDVLAVDRDSPVWKDNFTSKTVDLLNTFLPGIKLTEIAAKATDGSKWAWKTFSPRLGLTWDIFGDGKTIAKFSVARYGQFMGTGWADMYVPGGASGSAGYWWLDNGDSKVDFTELYWLMRRSGALYAPYRVYDDAGNFQGDLTDASGYYWSGFDPANPLKLTAPYGSRKPDAQDTNTDEILFSVDREILTDFAASVVLTYRKYSQFTWNLKYFVDANNNMTEKDNKNWYASAGKVPSSLPGLGDTKDASKHEWYYTTTTGTAYSPWYVNEVRPDYYQDYFGVDLILNKRLSNKWMLNANFTWQTQAQHYGDNGWLNKTNLWAYEGYPQAAYIGGASGKENQYTYSRWMFKVGGLYQAPFGIDISGTFQAREGWILQESFNFYNYTLPNPSSVSSGLVQVPFGTNRMPLFYNLNFRVEKLLKVADRGRLYIMFDLFNALNLQVENRRYQMFRGDYYYYGDGDARNRWVPWPNFKLLNEILNPRVMRIGLRFQI